MTLEEEKNLFFEQNLRFWLAKKLHDSRYSVSNSRFFEILEKIKKGEMESWDDAFEKATLIERQELSYINRRNYILKKANRDIANILSFSGFALSLISFIGIFDINE